MLGASGNRKQGKDCPLPRRGRPQGRGQTAARIAGSVGYAGGAADGGRGGSGFDCVAGALSRGE